MKNNKKSQQEKSKIIIEILKKDDHKKGVLPKEIYSEIEKHPNFKFAFPTTTNGDGEPQFKSGTRTALQKGEYGSMAARKKDQVFYRTKDGKWTYLDNHEFAGELNNREEIISNIDAVEKIAQKLNLSDEERYAFVKLRINQTIFRNALIDEMEQNDLGSPIRRVSNKDILIASHILDYKDCVNEYEKAVYHNGLLLSPDVDKLFDRKFISFDEKNGKILFSKNPELSFEVISTLLDELKIDEEVCLPTPFLTNTRKEFLKKRNDKYNFK